MEQLTEHFSIFEARCRCGCGIEQDYNKELTAQAQILEALRADLNADPDLEQYKPSGGEIRLFGSSWIRCPEYNKHKDVGGTDNSRHLPHHGDATDVSSPELPTRILYEKGKKYFNTAIHYAGRYFVHYDRRTWWDKKPHAWVKAPSPTVEPARA